MAMPRLTLTLLLSLLAADRVTSLTCWAGSTSDDEYEVSECAIGDNTYIEGTTDDGGSSVILSGAPQSGIECSGTCSIISGGYVNSKTEEQAGVSFIFECYEAGKTCLNIPKYTMPEPMHTDDANLTVTTSQRCCTTDDCNAPPKKFVSACETATYDVPVSYNDDDMFAGGGGGGGGGQGDDDDDDEASCPMLTCIVPIAAGGGLMLIGFAIGTFFYLKKKNENSEGTIAVTADESGDSNTLYNPLSGGGGGEESHA